MAYTKKQIDEFQIIQKNTFNAIACLNTTEEEKKKLIIFAYRLISKY